ncbi:hypothetical protein A9977_12050 [Variovorax sp. UMC13]|nr:hypothetical protein [Variovorax sp. UMC13]
MRTFDKAGLAQPRVTRKRSEALRRALHTDRAPLFLACVTLFSACVLGAVWMAYEQGVQRAQRRASELSVGVLRRAELIATQIDAAMAAASMDVDPATTCGIDDIARMLAVQSRYSHIGALARIAPATGLILCSTFGPEANGFALPLPDHVRRERSVRLSVRPVPAGADYFVIAQGDVAAFVHSGVASMFLPTIKDVSLGAFIKDGGPIVLHRGTPHLASLRRLEQTGASASFDGSRLLSLSASRTSDYIAFVDFPATWVRARIYDAAAWFIPLGAVLGLALSALLFLFLRNFTSLPAALRRALQTDRVYMEYQPIVDMRSGRCVGAEALVRWRRGGVLVPPDRFIGAAERSGLMPLVTRRVVQLVAADTAQFLRKHPEMHVSINFSALDLRSGLAVELLTKLLATTGLPARNYWLEVTETSFVREDMSQVINQIRALGVRVAIDDFGTGYANLDVLAGTKADLLKIDRQFVHAAVGHGQASEVALAIFGLARTLCLEMVAEGVETQAQAEFLIGCGVQYAQGWLFGRPNSVAALSQWLDETQRGVSEG